MQTVYANLIYTGSEVVRNRYVNFEENKIVSISDKPEGEILYKAEVITPAFIDPHSHIGMVRSGEPSDEEESNETFESIVVLADAIDSVYMDDNAFKESIEHGVLYSCVLPGSGNIIGGRAALIRNFERTTDKAFMKHVGIKAALGYNPRSTSKWKGKRPTSRMGVMAIFREELLSALKALRLVEKGKKDVDELTPQQEALIKILKGEHVLRCHVHKEDDIAALLRLKSEFNLKITVEHASDVHSADVFRVLKEQNVPIVYGPVDSFPYKTELKHETWRNIRHIVEVEPLFALMSDHPVILQRNLYLQLRFLLRFGYDRAKAISTITLNSAKILGVSDILGSIEPGKLASIVLWDGDPFTLDSRVVMAIGEGKVVYQE
ncbi:MAG: imidazolonepropionase [Thermoprotei archaeon]|nr:MAG: imidazolonepropionase [Thermoprotei archaeon]